jgi:SsrA-binding protein
MKIVSKNRRATFDYEILEKLVAGLILEGTEVKSAKAGHVQLKGSYVSARADSAILLNSHISHYKQGGQKQHALNRERKLLLTKKQLNELFSAKQNGMQVIPLAMGIEHGYLKLEIGIGKSKVRRDKRQVIKKRESNIEAERIAKKYS